MPTQSLQGGIHGGFPSRPPRRSGLDGAALEDRNDPASNRPATRSTSGWVGSGWGKWILLPKR